MLIPLISPCCYSEHEQHALKVATTLTAQNEEKEGCVEGNILHDAATSPAHGSRE